MNGFLGARLVKLQPRRKSRKCRCKKNNFEDEKFVQLERNECTKKMTKFFDSLDFFFPSLSELSHIIICKLEQREKGEFGNEGKKAQGKMGV